MFVPSSYREPDSSWMVDLIRANPLALAAANGRPEDGPFATHLPVIFDPDTSGEWTGELPGATLLGHMNRANPHWAALESGSVLLLTFTGPHSYVSPTVYEVTPAAPTWNFTAVHVRGVVEKIDSVQETLGVVESTVRAFEGRFGDGWDMTASLGYFRKIAPAVGAFRFTVTGAEGMFKLSQEQPGEVRERVRESFGQSACTYKRETAGLMSRLPST
ncbi:FMN-binding negative transcriptional regulator [Streptomyces sp. NBC_01281]|uniref:FMN-binding negative transcriptional regulator n=2 Tax=unclassified Streptomyces TaxID=2593676 RepID=UPI00224D92DF|nr:MULTISPECIES: FMN-binding negative transcriptional regulator [unclassified Streptomyces]MCX5285638.1 FMN-binding negative transcriptional regulator [Streptomyces sp. NBC_00198]WSD74891.1 FMN-binding negative transcriptional regulator [Streptomyces sp. NBC_01558]WSK58449.1 FMN-binding negative transcriptional regulator [Streptomyces sp. NBC_01281]WSK65771.1 FMN-binding negative transcriptional regulator [Streptomyces sp. NBC_01281]